MVGDKVDGFMVGPVGCEGRLIFLSLVPGVMGEEVIGLVVNHH